MSDSAFSGAKACVSYLGVNFASCRFSERHTSMTFFVDHGVSMKLDSVLRGMTDLIWLYLKSE